GQDRRQGPAELRPARRGADGVEPDQWRARDPLQWRNHRLHLRHARRGRCLACGGLRQRRHFVRRPARLSRKCVRQALPRLAPRSRRQQALRTASSAMTIETVSEVKSHGGVQGVYRHASSATGTDMLFSVFVPDHEPGAKLPVLWYLSGLTCTHANVTEKGEFRAACAEAGIIFVAPDTSRRGEGVPDDSDGAWDFGVRAG